MRRTARILAFSGPSGVGKTTLLARLIPALLRRGLAVGAIKHTSHPHAFDRRGKDSERLRRAGAVAVGLLGPSGLAYFGPAVKGARALARLLPRTHVVLAEGFKDEALPRVEVHRRAVSREFLCSRDRRVVAVVTDEPAPRALPSFGFGEIEALADLVERFARGSLSRAGSRRRSPRGALTGDRPRWPGGSARRAPGTRGASPG